MICRVHLHVEDVSGNQLHHVTSQLLYPNRTVWKWCPQILIIIYVLMSQRDHYNSSNGFMEKHLYIIHPKKTQHMYVTSVIIPYVTIRYRALLCVTIVEYVPMSSACYLCCYPQKNTSLSCDNTLIQAGLPDCFYLIYHKLYL